MRFLILPDAVYSLPSLAEQRIGSGYTPNGEAVELFVDWVPRLKYPRKAQWRGDEGYADTRLDIKADGTKTDMRVLEAEPREIFDKAALEFFESMTIFKNFSTFQA